MPPSAEQAMPEAAPETALDAEPKPEPGAERRPKPDGLAKIRLSAGGGGFFASDFGGGVIYGGKAVLTTPYYGGGAYLFFDAAYAEVFFGASTGGGAWKWGANDKQGGSGPTVDMRRIYIDAGILAKYPFDAGMVKIFPLLGTGYERSVFFEVELPDEKYTFNRRNANAGVLSALWFKFGGGLDVDLSRNLYARAELLYGFRTVNNLEEDLTELYSGRKANPGHGLTVKTSGGVKF